MGLLILSTILSLGVYGQVFSWPRGREYQRFGNDREVYPRRLDRFGHFLPKPRKEVAQTTPSIPRYENSYQSSFDRLRSHRVFLTSESSIDFPVQGSSYNNLNLRIGQPNTFSCYCNSIFWLQSSYYAEVSFYYANISEGRPPSHSDRSAFKPLFSISRRNLTVSAASAHVRYHSGNASALSQEFQFSLPPLPEPYIPSVVVRLPVRSVQPSLRGAFFCRIRIISSQYDLSHSFDSEVVVTRPFAPISAPRLSWLGINDSSYAVPGERVTIGCAANVGFPPGALEISFMREVYKAYAPAGVAQYEKEQLPLVAESLTQTPDGSYERRVNCSWEVFPIPKLIDHYFSCRAIPSPELDMNLQELKDSRHLNIAYDISDVVVVIVPPFYSGSYQNGTYYLPAGSDVYCRADGMPRPVVQWEVLDLSSAHLLLGLNANGDNKLRSYYPSYSSDNEFKSPGLQRFRCRAVQQTRGRKPLEITRNFSFIVVDIPKPSFKPLVKTVPIAAPVVNDWNICEVNPNTMGCNSKSSSRSYLVLALIIASSVVFCVLFLAVVFFVAFRLRRRLFAASSRRAGRSDPYARRSAHRPLQYAESDQQHEPVVVTGESVNRRRGSRATQLWLPNFQSMSPAMLVSLLTPPDYDSATQNGASSPILPPPYDPKEASEFGSDSLKLQTSSQESATSDSTSTTVSSISSELDIPREEHPAVATPDSGTDCESGSNSSSELDNIPRKEHPAVATPDSGTDCESGFNSSSELDNNPPKEHSAVATPDSGAVCESGSSAATL